MDFLNTNIRFEPKSQGSAENSYKANSVPGRRPWFKVLTVVVTNMEFIHGVRKKKLKGKRKFKTMF